MSLSTAEIESVVTDLAPRLEGGKIERIDQPDPHKLVLTVRNGPALYWLLLSAHPRFSRIHLLPTRPEQGEPAAGFCNAVRQHITGAPLEALRQVPDDRVVVIESVEHDSLMRPHRVRLIAELMGVGSNLLLVDDEDQVLASLVREDSQRRKIHPGAAYRLPEPPGDVPPRARVNRFGESVGSDDPLALSRAIAAHYSEREVAEELRQARAEVGRVAGRALERARSRVRNIAKELQRAEEAEVWRRKGELLKIALPQVEKGQREVEVEDLFEPGRPRVTIELDPRLSPAGNLEQLFQRYKKAVAGRERLEERLEKARRKERRLEELAAGADAAGSVEELHGLKGDLRAAGVVFPEDRPVRPTERASEPRSFAAEDGTEILVARNDRQNERLTFSIARGNDYWLHVRGWPGPHVVVRNAGQGEMSQAALLDAAHLAIHFSRIRGTDYAEVAYTQCKNVRRLKGAPSGRVSYADASVLPVRFERRRLERLLGRTGQ